MKKGQVPRPHPRRLLKAGANDNIIKNPGDSKLIEIIIDKAFSEQGFWIGILIAAIVALSLQNRALVKMLFKNNTETVKVLTKIDQGIQHIKDLVR